MPVSKDEEKQEEEEKEERGGGRGQGAGVAGGPGGAGGGGGTRVVVGGVEVGAWGTIKEEQAQDLLFKLNSLRVGFYYRQIVGINYIDYLFHPIFSASLTCCLAQESTTSPDSR